MVMHDDGLPNSYYEAPNSLLSMDSSTYSGLLAIGALASISIAFTSALLGFITWRMINWKSHYTANISRNQSVLLIYQLLLADLLQSVGFLISFHWAAERDIIGPKDICFTQAWFIQLGDIASALFVLAIAFHTTYQVVRSKVFSHKHFVCSVIGVWGFALFLTSLVPIIGGRYVFLRAGVWCWISTEHEGMRLSLHYIWIFIVEFSAFIIYAAGFYYLFRAKRSNAFITTGRSVTGLRKARLAMLAYALAYTFLSLPIAAGRMASMSHHQPSPQYYLFVGALFTSSGWIDTILYALTRRSLLFDELNVYGRHAKPATTNAASGKDSSSQRQNSTDTILAKNGSEGNGSDGIGGIKMERTVKIELGDMESTKVSPNGVNNYFATAEALSNNV
ncbi:G protein-coupled glucose receptor regulating Gpa2-domain-containing protein [Hypoxylon sp. FL1284]|nr:G protein-coupled glucose receptor regulating Gpa2-domain-containing protein [Hypoxylon sp. FL1284]